MEPANRDPLWCTYGRLDSHAVHGSEANHGGVFKSVLGEAVRLGIPEARVCCVCCASRVLRDHARHCPRCMQAEDFGGGVGGERGREGEREKAGGCAKRNNNTSQNRHSRTPW